MASVPDRPADSTVVIGNVHTSHLLGPDGLSFLVHVVSVFGREMPTRPTRARLTAAPDRHRAGFVEITLEAWRLCLRRDAGTTLAP